MTRPICMHINESPTFQNYNIPTLSNTKKHTSLSIYPIPLESRYKHTQKDLPFSPLSAGLPLAPGCPGRPSIPEGPRSPFIPGSPMEPWWPWKIGKKYIYLRGCVCMTKNTALCARGAKEVSQCEV